MIDEIAVPTGTILAMRRLLWDIGATDTTQHDQKVECFHWGATLDSLAGMPSWPVEVNGIAESITFYENVRDHVQKTIEALRRSGRSED
jgi:hypothetical protein